MNKKEKAESLKRRLVIEKVESLERMKTLFLCNIDMLIFIFGIIIVILLFTIGSSLLSLIWGTLYSFCGCDDPCDDIGG